MSKSLIRVAYTGALVLGLATIGSYPGIAQHRPSSAGPGSSSGPSTISHAPTTIDRDTSVGRSQDRQNRAINTNSNGINATDRDKGLDRARDRMSQPGLDNNKAGDARGNLARARVEADGYKNVQGLTKGSDGLWHGRALRGGTEVPVTVDARGNVSAN